MEIKFSRSYADNDGMHRLRCIDVYVDGRKLDQRIEKNLDAVAAFDADYSAYEFYPPGDFERFDSDTLAYMKEQIREHFEHYGAE